MSLKFSKALISGVVHLEYIFRFGPTTLIVQGWIKFQFNVVISQLTLERLHFLH